MHSALINILLIYFLPANESSIFYFIAFLDHSLWVCVDFVQIYCQLLSELSVVHERAFLKNLITISASIMTVHDLINSWNVAVNL